MLGLECGKVKLLRAELVDRFQERFWFCAAAAFALALASETAETRNRLAPITCSVKLRELSGKRWCSTRANIRAHVKTPKPSQMKPTFRVLKYPRSATTTIAKYKMKVDAARMVGSIGFISELYHVCGLARA
jgi:hypothetical protein